MGDTCSGDMIAPLAMDADLIIHEATNAWFSEQVMTNLSPTALSMYPYTTLFMVILIKSFHVYQPPLSCVSSNPISHVLLLLTPTPISLHLPLTRTRVDTPRKRISREIPTPTVIPPHRQVVWMIHSCSCSCSRGWTSLHDMIVCVTTVISYPLYQYNTIYKQINDIPSLYTDGGKVL